MRLSPSPRTRPALTLALVIAMTGGAVGACTTDTETLTNAGSDGATSPGEDDAGGTRMEIESGTVDAGGGQDAASDAIEADASSPIEAGVGEDGGSLGGTLVVAAREGADRPADIFLVAEDGGGLRQVTQTPSRHELQPRWSPDRSKIAFLALPADAAADANASLVVIDADGSNERVLATDVSGALAWSDRDSRWPPAWSPAGDRIAYVHHLASCAPPPDPSWWVADPCVSDIRVVDATTGSPIPDLTLPSTPLWSKPVWIATGKWATEPVWLATGPLLYVWTCFGDSCPGTGPWLVREQAPSQNMEFVDRHFAFTRSATRFLAAEHNASYANYAYRESTGPLRVCDTERGFASHISGSDCVGIGGDANGWSPRWSPGEDGVAFLRDDGVWVQRLGASRAEHALATTRPAGLDW